MLIFSDGSKVQLGPNSNFKLLEITENKSTYDRILGHFHATVDCLKKIPETLRRSATEQVDCGERRFRTSRGIAIGVRGTEFDIHAPPEGPTAVVVLAGVVEIQNIRTGKIISAKAGESISITTDGIVGEPQTTDLKTFVRWWEEDEK